MSFDAYSYQRAGSKPIEGRKWWFHGIKVSTLDNSLYNKQSPHTG